MTTLVGNTGRYVMYSIEVDAILAKNQAVIEKFKGEKIQELLAKSPYNLTIEAGRVLAIHTIRDEFAKSAEVFAHEQFDQFRHDIAFHIVANATRMSFKA